MVGNQFFLGRQPIVGRDNELVAYEFLFRSNETNAAVIADDVMASAAVIQYLFSGLGMDAALGGKRGFINLSEELLMSESIELLPQDKVVLEILETVPLTPRVAARCGELKNLGYTLALDDITELTPAHRNLMPLIDVVKLDVLGMPPEQIAAMVVELKPFEVTLLAEKIDTMAQHAFCHGLDFDLFQGFFFARPVMLTGRTVQPSALGLLNLLGLIARDAEIEEIEEALKQAPDLTVHLLKIANSAAFNLSRKISSVRGAIARLGRIQLNRLVQIMMFSQQNDIGVAANPLLQTAVIRGRMMEGLADLIGCGAIRNQAFMTGMLSLMDALFQQPLGEILATLNLETTIQQALLGREGQLGVMLRLIEASERIGGESTISLMARLGLPDLDAFNRVHAEALAWSGHFS
ncbi:cyclic diguanylate phosphodiesterase [Acidocella aquatica]|uniref:Cyclic diguanylate phosphodiesterase n=1 Tax=Acidocella aquatica TaxID=1922313 RepID=A0ABQ6A771_9PROT|nr:HDOD domain-containing protein [Acidocella aquatica]GLR65969.1 cyclic diguanylate phosphodiesterase [Acidocella aquatica]